MNQKSKNTVQKRWDYVGNFTCDCTCVNVCECVCGVCVCVGCNSELLCVYVWVIYNAYVYEDICAVPFFTGC